MDNKEQVKQTTIADRCVVCGIGLTGKLDTFTQESRVLLNDDKSYKRTDTMCWEHFIEGWVFCIDCNDFVPSNKNGWCNVCSNLGIGYVPAQGEQLALGVS